MEKETNNAELTDKKSYAGIPEAEFVVRFTNLLSVSRALLHSLKIYFYLTLICLMIFIFLGRCRCFYAKIRKQ